MLEAELAPGEVPAPTATTRPGAIGGPPVPEMAGGGTVVAKLAGLSGSLAGVGGARRCPHVTQKRRPVWLVLPHSGHVVVEAASCMLGRPAAALSSRSRSRGVKCTAGAMGR